MSPAERFLTDPTGTLDSLRQTVQEWAIDAAAAWGVPAVVATAGLLAAAAIWRRRQRAALRDGARQVVILAPPEPEPSAAAALWANLHDLLRSRWRRTLSGQPHLSWEYAWSAQGLRISLWVPGAIPPGLVERAVEAAWPAARTATGPADDPLQDGLGVTAGELLLAAPGWFPLRTDHDADPLRALLGAAAITQPGEQVLVQVLARPATGRAVARCRRAARDLRAGQPAAPLTRLLDLGGTTTRAPRRTAMDPSVGPDVRAILDKADGPLWHAAVRYAVATPNDSSRDTAARRGRAHAVASAFAVLAGRNRLERHRLPRPRPRLSSRAIGNASLLSVPELAALAHLPTDALVPGLTRAGARTVPPPVDIPRGGPGVKVLGDADAGPRRPVGLAAADARFHVHVMGATGSGKSTLLTNLILQDVDAGRGCIVIDPKGDLITDVLHRLSPRRRGQAVVLDPQAAGSPPTLNMLEVPPGMDSDLVVEHLIGIFRNIFERHWGPRTDDVLRSACLTLVSGGDATLADVPKLLTNEQFRARKVANINDSAGLGGFWAWYNAQSEAQRAQIIGSPLNKLRAFLLRGFVRQIVDAPRSSIDMRAILDGGLLLARVPKGLLGDDTARLLGSFVVARAWQAATGRAALGETARCDSALYIDECQNFLTLPNSVADMLAEARGYRLSLVLAHQHLGQLSRDLRDAISANARNKVLFTMSPEDAHVLARHMAPELTDHDLSHLDAYQAACRLALAGQDQPAFTLRTRPLGARS